MSEFNYDQDNEIDPNALDIEWLEQSSLALRYGRHVTMLNDKLRRLQERKKTIRSELIIEANEDPINTCCKKNPNAGDIEAYYRSSELYKAVVADMLDVQKDAEFAEIAYQQIAWTRKAALEHLVFLYKSNYFAGPTIPRDLLSEYNTHQEVKQKTVDANIAGKLKRKT